MSLPDRHFLLPLAQKIQLLLLRNLDISETSIFAFAESLLEPFGDERLEVQLMADLLDDSFVWMVGWLAGEGLVYLGVSLRSNLLSFH